MRNEHFEVAWDTPLYCHFCALLVLITGWLTCWGSLSINWNLPPVSRIYRVTYLHVLGAMGTNSRLRI